VQHAELDGAPVDSRAIPLADDGATHDVAITLGTGSRHESPTALGAGERRTS
jgi:hypothetical protein